MSDCLDLYVIHDETPSIGGGDAMVAVFSYHGVMHQHPLVASIQRNEA